MPPATAAIWYQSTSPFVQMLLVTPTPEVKATAPAVVSSGSLVEPDVLQGVIVGVGVRVGVEVTVEVWVAVPVAVGVALEVEDGDGVLVGVEVRLAVAVRVGVSVATEPPPAPMLTLIV